MGSSNERNRLAGDLLLSTSLSAFSLAIAPLVVRNTCLIAAPCCGAKSTNNLHTSSEGIFC
jgi:hypothetical protein